MVDQLPFNELPHGRVAWRFEGHGRGTSVSFFITHGAPGTGPVLHRHPYEEVFIVEDGRATFTVADETVEAEGGHILIVPPQTPHKFVNSGVGELRMVSIHPVEQMVQEDLE
ncbi:MAG TPA: cupin domain-containing protein [Thermoleophilaceae bacterium]